MVDFQFYTDNYHGFKVNEALFNNLIIRARTFLTQRIGVFDETDENIMFVLCEIVDVLNDAEKPVSERVGSYAVTYDRGEMTSAIDEIISRRLPTYRKFRGVKYVY